MLERRSFLSLTFAIILALLAACGGPTPPPVPDATSLSPAVAERGDSITIAGTGFGTTPGTVTIGGVAAVATDWTATGITATVPAGAANAWQDVTVTTAGGEDTLSGLFVGAEYTGTGAGLQAFLDGLEPGSAALLQATAYDITAQTTPFSIDNVDVYGRGADQTSISRQSTGFAEVLADHGMTTTVADVTIDSSTFTISKGSRRVQAAALGGGASASAFAADVAATGVQVGSWVAAVLEYAASVADAATAAYTDAFAGGLSGGLFERPHGLTLGTVAGATTGAIEPAAADLPRVVFDGARFTASDPAPSLWGNGLTFPAVHLEVRDTSVDFPDGTVQAGVLGDILIESSAIDSLQTTLVALFGSLSVHDSDLTSEASSVLGAQAGLLVDASTVTVANGQILAVGMAASMFGGASVTVGGPIEVRGSSLRALDADFLDASATGAISMMTVSAPIALIDNVSVRSHNSMIALNAQGAMGESDIVMTGNTDVRAGVFTSESATGARPESIILATQPDPGTVPSTVTVAGNTLTASQSLQVVGSITDVILDDNVIAVGDAAPTGDMMITSSQGALTLNGNDITFKSQLIAQVVDMAGATMTVTGNTLTNVTPTVGTVILQGPEGSCVVEDNVVELDDPSDTDQQQFLLLCPTTAADGEMTVSGNTVTTTGHAASGFMGLSTGIQRVSYTDNGFTVGNLFNLGPAVDSFAFTGNTVSLSTTPVVLPGSDGATYTVSDNTFTHHDPAGGLLLYGMTSALVTDNTFTATGTPGADAVALNVLTGTGPMTVTATGNTFTDYSRALAFTDVAVTAHGFTAAINDNVFDFVIDAAPKVARLVNVGSEIDARNNQWGSNTSLATVAGYVGKEGDTVTQGGEILLDPITQP